MTEIYTFLLQGLLLGFSAGISPGPLTALTISQTIKYSRKDGIKVAISPLVTDIPIVTISLLIFAKLTNFDFIMGLISLLGALFLIYLGLDSWNSKGIQAKVTNAQPQSLFKGALVNLLSPNPYLFWLAIGSPIVLKAYAFDLLAAILFILSFYLTLVGSKVIMAFLIDKSRNLLNNKLYLYIMKALGVSLIIFAIFFFLDAAKYLI